MNALKKALGKFSLIDIYPVIIPEFCSGRDPVLILEAVLRGGAKIVQLRDKSDPARFAAEFRELTRQFNALLIINDSVAVALEYDADGVHLGQDDWPVKRARKKAPELLIGVSTHNLNEALAAEQAGASYINIGPIFPTKTKGEIKEFIGVQAIKEIAPKIKLPFTVMGGITGDNLDAVLMAGAHKIAMATAITQAEKVEETTRQFIKMRYSATF